MKDMNVEILKNCYLKEDGKLDREESKLFSGKVAGVCYAKEGYRKLENEDVEKTKRRISMTMDNGHHSVYDHVTITLNLENIPKILAMVLNNEHQYTTSEKSARYTKIVRMEGSVITENEEILYNKWLEIFKIKIKEQYGNVFDDSKITKLAQENARYLVTVFCPTTMVYTTTFRQINYIASWMKDYIEKAKTPFELKLAKAMKEFISCLEKENILEPGLMMNDKCRKLSIFGSNLENKRPYFGDVYQPLYKGSFAQYAQAHRHRTLNYQLQMLDEKEYFVPPIIEDDEKLVNEWLSDIKSVSDVTPQGELVLISEDGNYSNFILKCKERLCSAAQLEIMRQTLKTLLTYQEELERTSHPLSEDIKMYTKGSRCTFNDYKCSSSCNFKEGINCTRKI